MNYKEFCKLYIPFQKKFKGEMLSKQWFETLEKNHQKLREKLGGISREVELSTASIFQPVPVEEIKSDVAKLAALIPDWFKENNLKVEDFCLPTVQTGEKKNIKWGKKIEYWRKRNAKDISADELAKILGVMGEKWAKYKSDARSLYGTISTHPMAFATLGHYVTDINQKSGNPSCWAQHKGSARDKYTLASHKNSYVLFITKKPLPETWDEFDIECRSWGVASEKLDCFYLSNIYYRANRKENSVPIGTVDEAIKAVFGNILESKVKRYVGNFAVSGVYQNEKPIYTFIKDGDEVVPMRADMAYNGSMYVKPCYFCHMADGEIEIIDNYPVCENCLDRVPKCAMSGVRGFHMVEAWIDGGIKKVHHDIVGQKGWKRCAISGYFADRKEMEQISSLGTLAIPHFLKSTGYKKCKCGKWSMTEECDICSMNKQLQAKHTIKLGKKGYNVSFSGDNEGWVEDE
jgi:hypothetical protein